MKNRISLFAGASALALALVTSSFAIPITGSIAFNGQPNLDEALITNSTGIVSYNSGRVAIAQHDGTFLSVPGLTPVQFSPFTFSPATQVVAPLWSFTYNDIAYSFSTTSMVSVYNPSLDIWNFGGAGVFHVTGFDNTPGTWNFSLGQIGSSLYFGSAAAASATVPETGMTSAFVGLGLGLMVLSRRFRPTVLST